ncbi:MAG: winged helix-turn-helix transcriptional regulator [Pseudomonadota bacterium]
MMGLPGDPEDEADEPAWFEWDDSIGDDPEETGAVSQTAWLSTWIEAARTPEVMQAVVGAAESLSRLESRLVYDPDVEGAAGRLAQDEAGDAMWLAGDAGARDRLALYAQGVRAAIDERDQLAHWALRRLMAPGDPSSLNVPALRDFLGRARPGLTDSLVEDSHDLFPQPTGTELDDGLGQWLDIATRLHGHHRIVRAAILYRAWRWLNLSGAEDAVTPMVVASRIAGGPHLHFAPFAGAARRMRTFAVRGTESDRLYAMIRAFAEGALQASLSLEQLAAWRLRAMRNATTKATRAIVDATARHPVASSNAIADATGMTPQAVNKAARILHEDGLIREATGQSRFRLWQAAM